MDSKKLSMEEKFPEVAYTTWVDPRTRSRKKPMEVLVIGMMRTGTMSMRKALQQLGYDGVYHMASVIQNPPDSKMWTEFFKWKAHGEGKPFTRDDWDHLLSDVQACCDVPTAAAMPELIAAYPEAKVIVAERDVEKWFKSFEQTITMSQSSVMLRLLQTLDTDFLGPWREMIFVVQQSLFGPKSYLEPPEVIKRKYVEEHEKVRQLVPAERRLEYKLGMGWEPLCEFLDKPVPDGPFPHVNETQEFLERVEYMGKTTMKRLALGYLPYVATAAVAGVAFLAYGKRLPGLKF